MKFDLSAMVAPWELPLEWSLWFVPLYPSLDYSFWFYRLCYHILDDNKDVLKLIKKQPLNGQVPTYLKIQVFPFFLLFSVGMR